MRVAIHASNPGVRAALLRAVEQSGYDNADVEGDKDAQLVLVDLGLGVDAIRAVCRRVLRAGLGPLVAVVGAPKDGVVEELVEAGVTICVDDETLPRRLRFLGRAVEQRGRFEELAARISESEARHRAVIDALDEALIVQDAHGNVTSFNRAAARILGMSDDKAPTRPWSGWNVADPSGAPVAPEDMPAARALRTGEPARDCVLGLQRAGAEPIWISANAQPVRAGDVSVAVVTTFRDVTARWRAYGEFREMLDLSFDAVFVHRDRRIIWANKRAVQLLGYASRDEVVGMGVMELTPPRLREHIADRLQARAHGQSPPPGEGAFVRKDGGEIPMFVFGAPTMFEGEPALIAFARDLTSERRLEKEIEASTRLAALGRLAAYVGHEINNPLTYVIGSLHNAIDLLRARAPAPDVATAEALDLMNESMDGLGRVQRLARELKLFTTRPTEVLGAVDLHRVIETSARVVDAHLKGRAGLVRDLGDIPLVRANEPRLAQVVLNLLVNAAQAIPEGDRTRHAVTVSTRRGPDGRVILRVTDTGVGIAPADLERVFEPFYTTKGDKGGTGLGLPICHALVTQQGGDIAIASELGRGTTVTVRLCAADEALAASGAPAAAEAPAVRRRVLLVDDEVRIARVLREGLVAHDVSIATSGAEALAHLETDRPVDVIVCDLMMPGMSGIEVHERVRALRPGLERRMVFITGGAFTPSAMEFLARVPNPRLEKPFRIHELAEVIDAAAAL